QYNIYKWYGKEINFIDEKFTQAQPGLTYAKLENGGIWSLAIDCFDNQYAREVVETCWQGRNVYKSDFALLHCGFSDKLTFEICWAENYEVPEDNPNAVDICELPGAGSFINLASSVASIAVSEFIRNGTKRNFIGNRFSVREMI
ncbi:MAG: hypothetical protein V3U97_04735, partial [bacterium]